MFNTWIALLSFMQDEFVIKKTKQKKLSAEQQQSMLTCSRNLESQSFFSFFFLSSLSIYLIASGSLTLSLSLPLPLSLCAVTSQ